MLMGMRLQAKPNAAQKLILSKWMGCARFIWNSKCDEDKYLSIFAKKFMPIGTFAPFDAAYSQYKKSGFAPWLKECPSQILRNSASNWKFTYDDFLKGRCGKPKKKIKDSGGSIYLTRELFNFEKCADGVTRLFIGTKTNNIGYLSLKFHAGFTLPNSIYVKKKNGDYWIAFCHEVEGKEKNLFTDKENLEFLSACSDDFLDAHTVGIDRGVVRPVQCGDKTFDFSLEQKRKKRTKERYIKRFQKKLSRQQKSSKRRAKTKLKIGKAHKKIANIRKDFCHKTSRAIVNDKMAKIIILEDLKTKGMTKKPKARPKDGGGWEKNNARSKAGLNRSILDKGWHRLEAFLKYKAFNAGKAVFKVSAYGTSQECADCEHTHPSNRRSQALFLCGSCGHTDNADHNSAVVIKKRAIKFILHPGTGLSKRGVLLDTGRGAKVRHEECQATHAVAAKRQKRRESSTGQVLEALPIYGEPSSA